jgi:hypothetical protein
MLNTQRFGVLTIWRFRKTAMQRQVRFWRQPKRASQPYPNITPATRRKRALLPTHRKHGATILFLDWAEYQPTEHHIIRKERVDSTGFVLVCAAKKATITAYSENFPSQIWEEHQP